MRRLWKLEKARACAPLEPLKRLALPTPGFTPPCGLSQTPEPQNYERINGCGFKP